MEYAAIAMAVVGILGGLAQMYNSEEASGASKQRLDEIKKQFDSIKPPNYNVSITDPPAKIQQAVKEPQYDFAKWTPEQYKVVAQYAPQVAPYVAEKSPQLVKYSSQGEEGLEAQRGALRQYIDLAKEGRISPALEAKLNLANKQGQAEAQSRSQSLMQDYQRRGQLGSGAMLAAQLSGQEGAMDRAANQSQQAAIEAERERLQALAQSGQLGGQMAQQDLSLQDKNAQIMNDFNRRTSANDQAWQQYMANTMNDAQSKNLNMQQSAADKNVGATNDASKYNRDYLNQIQDKLYNARIGERNYANQNAQADAEWKDNQRRYGNTMASQQYSDQISQAKNRQGIADQYNTLGNQQAQARNSAIQGAGEGVLQGISQYSNAQEKAKDRKAKYGYDEEEGA